jgi:hypothetical protein
MPRDYLLYLGDMLEALARIHCCVGERTFDDLVSDDRIVEAPNQHGFWYP